MPFAIENMPLDGPVAKYGDAYGLAAHAIAGFCDICRSARMRLTWMQVCEPSAGLMLMRVSVVVVPLGVRVYSGIATIDHTYESPFCGSGFIQVNCTLPPSAEYDPVRFSTLGTLPVVMAESGESFS